MGPLPFLDWVRLCIGSIAWRILLWSLRKSEDEYFTEVYFIEKQTRPDRGLPL